MSEDKKSFDLTEFTVIYNSFEDVVREMSLTFEYSSWSSILSECRDFSCAIYDSGTPPNALCVLDGLPLHVNAQPITLSKIVEFFGDEIYEGDIIMVNSVYFGTTHCGDLVVAAPVFHEGELLFWTAATGHQMDIGGASPSSVSIDATDVWSEGFQISPIKLEEKGKPRKDVWELYLQNVRYRDFLNGDLMSQVGSVKTGRKRATELVEKYGAEKIKLFSNELIEYADRIATEEIKSWPDGVYHSESWVDSDGTGMTNMEIKCKLEIKGSEIYIDYAGSHPQVTGSTNASWATCFNATSTPILACLPPDLPHNHGCSKHIHVSAPKGTIVNLEYPGCASDATIVPSDSICDAIWKCLAHAIPDKVVAGYGHIAPNAFCSGIDRRIEGEETPFSMILFNSSSGGGASKEFDGWPMMFCPGALGGLKFIPIELLELHNPLQALQQEIRTDSMGAGKTRGGPGVIWKVKPAGTGQVDNYGYGDGMFNPPFGLFGGKPGDGGAMMRHNEDGTKTFFSALGYFRVKETESWETHSTGGGGYGNPLERDPEKVRMDVLNEYISLKSAKEDYGVVLLPDTLEIDEKETENLRKKIAKEMKIQTIVPTEKDAGNYYKRIMKENDEFLLNPRPSEDASWTL